MYKNNENEEKGPVFVPPSREGRETVLIAEDDTALRQLSRIVLERVGYKVITAFDGEDALNKFVENKEDIDLLIFDIIMPKKNGREVYEEIRRMMPGIRVLFISGYPAGITKGILKEGLSFLLKPISPNELTRKIREVLDR